MKIFSKKKILIVEDETSLNNALTKTLEREGYKVESEIDGSKAIGRMQVFDPDLVILDIMLPRQSGTEILKQMRGQHMHKNCPVLVLTNATIDEHLLSIANEFEAKCLDKSETSLENLLKEVNKRLQ